MLHQLLDSLASSSSGFYKLCLAIGLFLLLLSYKNAILNPTFAHQRTPQKDGATVAGVPPSEVLLPAASLLTGSSHMKVLTRSPNSILISHKPVSSHIEPAAAANVSLDVPTTSHARPFSQTAETSAHTSNSVSQSNPSASSSSGSDRSSSADILAGRDAVQARSASPHKTSGHRSDYPPFETYPPFNRTIRIETTALIALRPPRDRYRANNPYHLAAHIMSDIGSLACRSWPSSNAYLHGPIPFSEPSPALSFPSACPLSHIVLRLPSSQFALDLRPFSRFILTLCLLLAAQESGIPSIEQIHLISPRSGLRGAAGSHFDRWTINLALQGPDDIFSRPWIEEEGSKEGDKEENSSDRRCSVGIFGEAALSHGSADGTQGSMIGNRVGLLWDNNVTLEPERNSQESEAGWGGNQGNEAISHTRAQASTTTTLLQDLGSFGRTTGIWQASWDLQDLRRAERLRKMASRFCAVDGKVAGHNRIGHDVDGDVGGRLLRVLVYNRDSTRRLREAHAVASRLRESLPTGSHVDVVIHSDSRPICEVVKLLAEVDAVITPHGFTSMFLLFMRAGSMLVEVMPYQFHSDEYGPLAAAFGVHHVTIPSGPVRKLQPVLLDMLAVLLLPERDARHCRDYSWCRFTAKNFPVKLEEEQLAELSVRLRTVSTDNAQISRT